LGFVDVWFFILTLPTDPSVTFHKDVWVLPVNDSSTKADPARLGRISDKKEKGLRFQRMWTLRRSINYRFHKLADSTTEQCYSIWQWRRLYASAVCPCWLL